MSKQKIQTPQELDLSFNFTAILNTHNNNYSITNYIYSFFTKQNDSELQMRLKTTTQQLQELSDHDFSYYLNSLTQQLTQYKKSKSCKQIEDGEKQQQKSNIDLVRCFKDVPYIYFQKEFCLNFDDFKNKTRSKQIQQNLNQYLDLIQINLFRQVNNRFNDFFKILQNFQFLDLSITQNVQKLKNMRQIIKKVQTLQTIKAIQITNKIRIYQNKEKVYKYLKIMRSLKKLPPTLNTILQSTLPYQGITLLSSGKQSYKLVKDVQALKFIGHTLDNGDTIIKHSLYKQFSDKTFLYVTSSLNPPYTSKFRQIPFNQNMNNSVINETIIEEESFYYDTHHHTKIDYNNKPIQAQISRTILQSYLIIDYNNNSQFRIKLIEYLKIITKGFMQQLKLHLCKIVSQQSNRKQEISVLAELNNQKNNVAQQNTTNSSNNNPQQNITIQQLIDKINLSYFSKIMLTYHQMFKISLMRFYGCLEHLYQGFKKSLSPSIQRVISIIQQFLNIFYNLCKYVCDKVIYILTLKKLTQDTTISEFHNYVSQLLFWQDFATQIFFSQVFKNTETNFMTSKILQFKTKLITVFQSVKTTKQQLQNAYISNLHKNVLTYEIKSSLQEQIWNAVQEIPYHYLNSFNYIINGQQKNTLQNQNSTNRSILDSSILNDSVMFSRRQRSRIIKIAKKIDKVPRSHQNYIDIKLVKNAIIINKKHFKTTVSFLLFVQILQQYLKIIEIFPETKDQMLIRISQITRFYSTFTFQLIVGAGALKFQKIKSKNITARHLCLSCNCLQMILLILKGFSHNQIKKAIQIVSTHIDQISKKLSVIMSNKIQNEITNLHQINLKNQKNVPTQSTLNIINIYKQMFEILEQYLNQETIVGIMSPTVNLLLRKYISFLQDKGNRGKQEGKYFIQQMSVLNVGFQKQYDFMTKMFL